MLKNFRKLVCVSLFFYFHYFKQFFRLYSIKSLYIVLAILLLRSLKNSSDNKSMRVTSLSTCSTYIIKEIEKLVSSVYSAIMHLGNVGRILEKRVKHSATPRVLHASLVFPQHSPRALSHHKRTRLVFYFLNTNREPQANINCMDLFGSLWCKSIIMQMITGTQRMFMGLQRIFIVVY